MIPLNSPARRMSARLHGAIIRSMKYRPHLGAKTFHAVEGGAGRYLIEKDVGGRKAWMRDHSTPHFVDQWSPGMASSYPLEAIELLINYDPPLRLRIVEHDEEMNVQRYEIVPE